jgi:hypothetical protein
VVLSDDLRSLVSYVYYTVEPRCVEVELIEYFTSKQLNIRVVRNKLKNKWLLLHTGSGLQWYRTYETSGSPLRFMLRRSSLIECVTRKPELQIKFCVMIWFINFLSNYINWTWGPSWSYGSWIYNYLCNQYLLPLTLWVWIPLSRDVLDTTFIYVIK